MLVAWAAGARFMVGTQRSLSTPGEPALGWRPWLRLLASGGKLRFTPDASCGLVFPSSSWFSPSSALFPVTLWS